MGKENTEVKGMGKECERRERRKQIHKSDPGKYQR
jgi:hypothetical protein